MGNVIEFPTDRIGMGLTELPDDNLASVTDLSEYAQNKANLTQTSEYTEETVNSINENSLIFWLKSAINIRKTLGYF